MPESSRNPSSSSQSLYYGLARGPPFTDPSLTPDNETVDTRLSSLFEVRESVVPEGVESRSCPLACAREKISEE